MENSVTHRVVQCNRLTNTALYIVLSDELFLSHSCVLGVSKENFTKMCKCGGGILFEIRPLTTKPNFQIRLLLFSKNN